MLHTFSIPRSTTRLYCGSGQIVENDSLVMTRFAGGFLDGGGNARYYMTDYQGNNIAVIGADGAVIDRMGYYPYGLPWDIPSSTDYLFADKEYQHMGGLDEYIHGARRSVPYACAFSTPDALCEKRPWESPYLFCGGNPVRYVDPDGKLALPVVGAIVGSVIGAGIELCSQLLSKQKINWNAVAGAAVQGAVSGAVAGATCGMSLLASTATMAAANAAGGAINNAIQGNKITVASVVTDAVVGGAVNVGGKALSSFTKSALDGLSNQAKGKLGEMCTKIKYTLLGNVANPKKFIVETGRSTPKRNNPEVAKYDFLFKNRFTGKKFVRESKFNSSGLTPNQQRAWGNCKYPIEVDRTTSEGISNRVDIISESCGAIIYEQIQN